MCGRQRKVTFQTSHFKLHSSYLTLHSLKKRTNKRCLMYGRQRKVTLHSSDFILQTSQLRVHTSHIIHYTSYFTVSNLKIRDCGVLLKKWGVLML